VRSDEGGSVVGSVVGDPVPVGALRVETIPYEIDGHRHVRHEGVVEFVVPDVPHGTYVLWHCNEGCTEELGDLIGGWFRIGPPPEPPERVEAPPIPSAIPSATIDPSSSAVAPVATGLAVGLIAGVAALVVRRRRS
jgi:hypothetical protein